PSKINAPELDAAEALVRGAIASITRRELALIAPALSLRGDLGFDSLMLLELLVALETQVGRSVDSDRLNTATTVHDVEQIVRETRQARLPNQSTSIERAPEKPLQIPEPVREAAMHFMGRAQIGFYDKVLSTSVTGRAFIPHNRNTIVAANHA